jgi:hypothetical protein
MDVLLIFSFFCSSNNFIHVEYFYIYVIDALNNTGCMVYNDWVVENNELGGMWKNEIIAYHQVLFYNLLDETEKNHADRHKGSLYSSQNSNWMASKYR